MSYRVLSLYSGAGGMDRALPQGYEVAAFCEAAAYPRSVLALRHPGIPIYQSDEEVTSDRLNRDGIGPIHMVIGGPPCQEFSMAGRRLGAAGARNRFPEYLRIVRELRPVWCVAENVAGLRVADEGRYLGAVLWELADMGYRVGWGHWRAADAGAPHRRERIFIVGYLAHPIGDQRQRR